MKNYQIIQLHPKYRNIEQIKNTYSLKNKLYVVTFFEKYQIYMYSVFEYNDL